MQGLLVEIYRNAAGYDCTNNGITSRVTNAILCGGGMPEICEEHEGVPALILKTKSYRGQPYYYAVPADADPKAWYMFGGNFVYTSDSRFSEHCPYPIPVHDRRES